tara:strand:- start:12005 stop:12199 length:195 start_codon:yes stop_codon:yes gene_type:complete
VEFYDIGKNLKVDITMKVDAPKGYHWMRSGKGFRIMKDPKDGYKPHKGASKAVDFPVMKKHIGK